MLMINAINNYRLVMGSNEDLHYLSATNLVAALAAKKVSSVELVEKAIVRIEHFDKKINAVVVKNFEQALISAKAADKAISQHQRLPLLGLPITIKESFNLSGLPTTWGDPQYKNWCPDADALAITRLKNAGAIIIGKTNVPLMLQDWQTFNDIYGTTNNPWDLDYTPGGSSGGSAAALAAGFTSLELGSDFAGSIRVPANYCGVFGHKPSIDLIPMRGASPPTSSPTPNPLVDLIVAGPMARTAADLALALDVLAGPDELWDGRGYKLALPPSRHKKLNQFKVLILNHHPLCPTSEIVSNAINNLTEQLIKSGVAVSQNAADIPDLADITRTYIALFTGFVGSNIPEEVYQGFKIDISNLDPDDLSISACIARGCTSTHRDWLATMRHRDKLRRQFRALFKEFDTIICPVMPTPAFTHDHSDQKKRLIQIDGSPFPYNVQFSWASLATCFGLPSTVVPIDYNNHLPIGVQVIGDYLEDYTTIQFANLLEQELGGFVIPPLLRS